MLDLIPSPLLILIGVGVGVLLALPVGPANVLGLQRAVEHGFWAGIAAGLGAVIADGLLALAATFGISQIAGAFRYYRTSIQVIGGTVLVVAAYRMWFMEPRIVVPPTGEGHAPPSLGDYVWAIPQTFFLTITNPGAVLGALAIVGGASSFLEIESTIQALMLVASIVGGSVLWWVAVSHVIALIRHRVDLSRLRLVSRASSVLLLAFGGLLLVEVVLKTIRLL